MWYDYVIEYGPVWTLLRSVSNHICSVLLTIYYYYYYYYYDHNNYY